MLNGEPVISVGGQNYTSASNTVILPLNRGDRVWLQLFRGQLVELNDAWAAATLASFTLLPFINSIIELISVNKYSLKLCRGLASLVM